MAIAVVFTPFVLGLALGSPFTALWSPVSASPSRRRRHARSSFAFARRPSAASFRRRQTSSRFATFAEAFVVDRLGRDRGACGIRHVVRADARRDRGGHSRERAPGRPAAGVRATTRPICIRMFRASWPGLSRPSTPFFLSRRQERRGCPRHEGVYARLRRAMRGHDNHGRAVMIDRRTFATLLAGTVAAPD